MFPQTHSSVYQKVVDDYSCPPSDGQHNGTIHVFQMRMSITQRQYQTSWMRTLSVSRIWSGVILRGSGNSVILGAGTLSSRVSLYSVDIVRQAHVNKYPLECLTCLEPRPGFLYAGVRHELF